MVKTVRKILARRKADNTTSPLLAPFGGDHGFVFPSLSRDMKRVIPVAEVKERHQLMHADGWAVRDEDGEPVRVNTLPGIHVSRRTFNSVAAEIGIDLETREALMNHSGRGVNVKLRRCRSPLPIRDTRPQPQSEVRGRSIELRLLD